jgi:hypothetical protein
MELLEKALAIGGGVKDGLVIKRAGEFEPRRPGHDGMIVLDAERTCEGKVYCVSLTPLL